MVNSKILAPEILKDINDSLGDALQPLETDHDVIGREDELKALQVVLNKKERPVALLKGGHGTGKSALAGTYKNRLVQEGKHIEMFRLSIGKMADDQDQLKRRMNTLLEKMKEYKDEALKLNPKAEIILFIDEVHMVVSVFGVGSKLGGDLLKESLAEAEKFVKVITATTHDEYQKYIANDKALSRRLNIITIDETSPSLTLNILKDWLVKQTNMSDEDVDYTSMVDDGLLKSIIHANRIYQESEFEPAKSIDVLSSLISDSEVYNERPSMKTLARVLRTQYKIELGFSLNPFRVMEIFKSRIKGQPLATAEYDRIIKKTAFQLYPDSDKPRASILSVGTTGVGKTEACKSLALAMFGDRNAFVNISMTDYGDEDGARRLNEKVGRELGDNPYNILLFDEVEKGSEGCINAMLPMLDEGRVRYISKGQDGSEIEHNVSLRNAFLIATSNAGHKVLQVIQDSDDVEYIGEELTDELKIKARSMSTKVKKALGNESKLKPEFIARFNSVIPFRKLAEDTLIKIARRKLNELLKDIYDNKGIHITLPPDKDWSATSKPFFTDAISMYIVMERMRDETNAGDRGAREIDNVIDQDIFSEIIEAIYKYPSVTRFEINTDGNSSFENSDIAEARGLIKVTPVYEEQHMSV